MSLSEILQLYTPLAGLLVVVFWMGVLSERVGSLRGRLAKAEGDIAALRGEDGQGSSRILRLEITVENQAAQVASILRSLEGISRQLANLMQKSAPREYEST